jgi:hypothetical protein
MNPHLPRWVGLVNFLFVQWFFVRIAGTFEECGRTIESDGSENIDFEFSRYHLIRWVVPLTGWWSDYVRLGNPAHHEAHRR